jgi:anti-sigma regulatory factor (Ser/Thr protein kinase)
MMGGPEAAPPSGLVHRALVHGGEEEVLTHLAAFARQGVADGEATMILASPRRLQALRRELGTDAGVGWIPNHLASMRVGTAFDDVRRHMAGRAGEGRLRVAADWDLTGRTVSERRAFMRWEAAATAILAGVDATFLCCHDGADVEVAAGARATHPEVWTAAGWARDPAYRAPDVHLRDCEAPAPPRDEPMPLGDPWDLAPLRERIAWAGAGAGVDAGALADFGIAANEVAANALWHARGPRDARVGVTDGALVCEVRDSGPGLDPLTAHVPPVAGVSGGRGLWIAHQLADVVQVIPADGGSRVRLEVGLPVRAGDAPARGSRRSGREGDLGGRA